MYKFKEDKMKAPCYVWADEYEIEEGAIEQIKNASSLPFVFHHTALMPDAHQGYGVSIGSVVALKNVIIPNAVGVDIGCFSGNTKISLLNGEEKTLKELADENKPFYVYSVNSKKEITGAIAISRKTKENSELVLVTIDNNKKIKCTPDQRFMLRNGSYREAKDLKKGDSLMPLYRKYDKDNYESIYNPKTKTYQKTHWSLARNGLLGEIPSFKNQATIIHHCDFNQRNNNPDNLKFMSNKNHSKYHRSITERNTYWQSEEFEKKRIASIRNKIKTDKNFLKQKQEQGKKNILKYMKEHREEFLSKIKDNGKRGRKYLIKYNKSEKGREKSSEIGKKYGFGKRKNNHKVVSIKKLNYKEDVYDLFVEKYHNFALSAGIFVHNCGMCAAKTFLTDINTETLKKIMNEIKKVIPVGFNKHKEAQSMGWEGELLKGNVPDICMNNWENASKSLGTLGGGNHFIEIQKGNDGHIWIMIHSGSRNLGLQVANHYNAIAKKLNKKWCSNVPEEYDLAFLPADSEEGQAYIKEMNYCIDFALANRKLMMDRTQQCFYDVLYKGEEAVDPMFEPIINIAHNYASLENHYGKNVWVHRKGATLARKGAIGIIPGSQGTKSYIVKGLGNKESFESCSHGAGRKMGRKQAQRELNIKEETKQLNDLGVIHSIRSKKDLDEAPSAYKNITTVMKNQKDLVEILVELKPLAVIKG